MAIWWLRFCATSTRRRSSTFTWRGDQVRLQPANPTMDPIFAPAENVEIQGRVIMVMRRMN